VHTEHRNEMPRGPLDEAERLKVLRDYEILDTDPEKEFDDLTLLAAHICGTPMATISLVDENRQWFKSKIGLTETQTARDIAFCSQAILQTETFVIPDAQKDERFAQNPLVLGSQKIRFYAGAPMKSPDGYPLGVICVQDHVPRDLTPGQRTALQALSRQVVAQMELRRASRELRKTLVEMAKTRDQLSWKTAFFEAQINSSVDGVLVVDTEGKRILQNERMIQLWKIPRAIANDDNYRTQLEWVTRQTKNPDEFIDQVRRIYADPAQISRDEIELNDGTILDRDSSPVIGQDGRHYGRIWTFRDVTRERIGARQLSRVFELSPDMIFTTGYDGYFKQVNPAVEKITGFSKAELLARPYIHFTHPGEGRTVVEAIKNTIKAGAMQGFEARALCKDGSYRWLQINSVSVPEEQLFYMVARDITARKQTEEMVHLLGSAVEQSRESIVITDAELNLPGPRIIFVNPAFTKMTGYAPAEALGKTPRLLQGKATDRAVLDRLRHNLEQGGTFGGEAVNYRKNGEKFDLEWQIGPIRQADGTITHFVAVQHDITERKQMEARLFQAQKMETVGKLAGGVAHEFNSILTAIIGQSELLLSELPANGVLGNSAREIRLAADRAATLTRQLLAYGRKQILQPEILDLNRVLVDRIATLQHLMGREVNVRFVPTSGLHRVRIDPGQMDQVIVSLAMNASDAMPNGGKFTLETANVVLDENYVRAFPGLKPGAYVMLAVSDTGVGMNAEVKARAFEPFFSTKGVGQGTGLGLATCYGIIKQSDGHISLYSEEARGSTFRIYLPELEPLSASHPLPKSPEMPHGTETILLAEDDPSLLEMAANLLRRLGYTVLTATNGIEALNLKQQRDIGHIDLLLTDVVMPHMSGKELSDRIRAIYPHTKILFTSAYTENAIVNQGVLNEGVILLQKPFTPSALASKVREVLDRPLPHHENDPAH
jgi:two-component system cell cycle sensor histidine kinase/response regulator CckA